MKKTLFTLLACLGASAAVAGTASSTDSFSDLPGASAKRLSGSITAGYDTLANDRGVVLSHSVLGGDGSPFALLKYNYDFGQEGKWSWDGMLYFRDVVSGHRLYSDPNFSAQNVGAAQLYSAAQGYASASMGVPAAIVPANIKTALGVPPSATTVPAAGVIGALEAAGMSSEKAGMINASAGAGRGHRIKQANAESEWVLQNGMKYTQEKWNIAFGHTFIRGGVLGVFAKHFRHQGASTLNEVYIRPELTPAPWMSVGCSVRRGISGIDGWWFEPDVTFKAPLYMQDDKVKVAAVLKFAMAATSDYFDHTDSACNNGSQSYYIKFNTPWFVTDNFIVTPGVGFHWLGKGAIHCNKRSSFATATGNSTYVPFRNFAVVGSIMATYQF